MGAASPNGVVSGAVASGGAAATSVAGSVGAVYKVGGGVSAPRVLSKVDPEYPKEARKAKYSGTVLLSCIIDTNGRAQDIHVVKSLGMGLDEKAIEALRKWKFQPGMKEGQAVNVRAQIAINFVLL
jgi:periplasmic protein TonB